MNSLQWFGCFQLFILLCGCSDNSTTDISTGNFSSATPAPATHSPGITEEETLLSTGSTALFRTEEPTVVSEAPTEPSVQLAKTPEACLCDLTPDFCDIGCCCDTVDCGVSNLSTVFTGCPQKTILGICIEKWLMFRANVESSLITVTDSLFCVQPEEKAPQSLPAAPQFPALGDSYHFSPPESTSVRHSRKFYRVDDVIQTYFSNSSVRGLLRQPSSGAAASAFCINHNPAKFLRSMSLSCTRLVTPESCTTDPSLSARSYFSDLSLIKIPIVERTNVSGFLIPVTPLSDWPAPSQQNNSCINAVKQVEFVILYNSRGELTNATVNVVLADVELNQLLLQSHSVHFQLDPPNPTPGPVPAVGLTAGAPLICRFGEELKPLTSLGVSEGGECWSDPSRRVPVLFTHNSFTGCAFSSPTGNCSELRSQIYEILQGLSSPKLIAMNAGAQPDWTRIITQECPISMQETCESGCILPHSLSIQVLWARQGLIDLSQNYILGARFVFNCQKFKCPMSSALALTTQVTFADITVYPKLPRGLPQPHWKFPFGFFIRGAAELDSHVIVDSSDSEKVTWGLMLLTAMLVTGLESFSR
ncbi:tectonic-3-like [Pholidichthys leucotaenia]